MSCGKPAAKSSSNANWLMAAIVIIVLLLYIISPVDLIPDIIPVIGWIDDMVALAGIVMVVVSMLN